VGYCSPPKQYQFPPKTSGNPGGRPRRAKGRGPILERIANELCEVRVAGKLVKVTKLEVVLLAVRNATANGNPVAQRLYDKLLNDVRDEEEGPPVPKGVLIVPERLTIEEWEAECAHLAGGPLPPWRKRGMKLD
jgi:hypothetical protein